jgi:hypothetical protein
MGRMDLQKGGIGGVMVSVLTSSAIDRGSEPRSGQTKNYKIGICCFTAKYAALRRRTVWLGIRIMSVSEWNDVSTCGRLFHIIFVTPLSVSLHNLLDFYIYIYIYIE